MVRDMKDAFVMLEGDVVQWAHAQAAAKGTSVSRLLSSMLRERIAQALQQPLGMASGMNGDAPAVMPAWTGAAEGGFSHWPRRGVEDD